MNQSVEETKEQELFKGDHSRIVNISRQKAAEITKKKLAYAAKIVELEALVAKQLKGIVEVRFK